MRPQMVVTLRLLRARVTGTGLWCGACMLPSGLTVECLIGVPGGHTFYTTRRFCNDCGWAVTAG